VLIWRFAVVVHKSNVLEIGIVKDNGVVSHPIA